MLAGRVPFEADSTLSLIYKQINDPPPKILGIAPAIQKVIDRALAKKPEDRYPTAGDMAEDFYLAIGTAADSKSFLDDVAEEKAIFPDGFAEKTQKVRISLPEPSNMHSAAQVSSKPSGRKSLWVGLGILGVIGLIALSIGAFSIFSRPAVSSTATGPAISFTPTEAFVQVAATEAQEPVSPTPTAGNPPVEEPGLPDAEGMVEIASGAYRVGSDTADDYHSASMEVTLDSYWIDIFQVTFTQYQKFLLATGTRSPDIVGEGNHPIRGVTWDQAAAYCSWANKRLPTEAEWEVAGRGPGPDPQLYPWGNDPRADGNIGSLPDQNTYEVGTLPFNKSPFGVYDLAGNIWEWVGDPYASIPAGARILRGGRYGLPILELSYRLAVGPSDPRYVKFAGFRCAADQVKP
jgi:formylglycine-generating enzyme required for sulfatase activity